jgi:hypothetical protein
MNIKGLGDKPKNIYKKRVTNAENDWRRANMAKPVNNDSNI